MADRAEEIALAWARELPRVPVGSIGILTRIWQAGKLLSDDRRRALAGIGIDAATLDLLSTLRRAGPPYRLSTRELAAQCLITAGAVTQRVDRALESGLVVRMPPQRGTRTVLVGLTAAGHREVEQAVGSLLAHEQELVDPLAPEDQAELARLLALLLTSLRGLAGSGDEAAADDAGCCPGPPRDWAPELPT